MAGAGKRSAEYVPSVMRAELDKLSKADLMEVAYDLAIMLVGSESDEQGAYQAIVKSAEAIATSQERTAPKLALDFRSIARAHLALIEKHKRTYPGSNTQDATDFWTPYANGAK